MVLTNFKNVIQYILVRKLTIFRLTNERDDNMLGLEYIRTTFEDTTVTLANKLGISNVNISQWENGKKPIPEKRLEELHSLYNIPKEYFTKELTPLEQLKVQWVKAKKEYDASFIVEDVPIEFDENGEPTEYANVPCCDEGLGIYLREIEADIKVEKVIEYVRSTIKESGQDFSENYNEIDYADDKEKRANLIHKFVSLMKTNDTIFLAYILRAVELSEDDAEDWGENPYLDRNGLTKKIATVIKEWKDAEKKRKEVEYQEYKELFGVDNDD